MLLKPGIFIKKMSSTMPKVPNVAILTTACRWKITQMELACNSYVEKSRLRPTCKFIVLVVFNLLVFIYCTLIKMLSK